MDSNARCEGRVKKHTVSSAMDQRDVLIMGLTEQRIRERESVSFSEVA